jgi:hypothetical protein
MTFNLFSIFSRKPNKSADEPVATHVVPDPYPTQTVSPTPDSNFGTIADDVVPQPVVTPVEPVATPYQSVNQYQSTDQPSDAVDAPITTPQYTNIEPTGPATAASPSSEVIADVLPQSTTPPENNSPSSPTPTNQF